MPAQGRGAALAVLGGLYWEPDVINGSPMSKLYVSTYLGNRFYPLEPRIDDVAIEDIAHGLAYQCRFNGQTSAFYSVAQHSLIVAALVP